MQEGNKKKKWVKPKLIILTRGKPEEAVLAICKRDGSWDTTIPSWAYNGCTKTPIGPCTLCSVKSES